MARRILSVTMSVLGTLSLSMTLASAKPEQPGGQGNFRQELESFFERSSDASTGDWLGAVGSPEAMEAVRERIRGLSPEELAALEAELDAIPNWQSLPDALSAALGPDDLRRLGELSSTMLADSANIEEFRGEVGHLLAAMSLLGPQARARWNLDAETVRRLQSDLSGMSAFELAQTKQILVDDGSWGAVATGFDRLTPEARRGAETLAEHGPLTEQDLFDLEALRSDLAGLLAGSDALDTVAGATPEMLFVIRSKLDTAGLDRVLRDARLLNDADGLIASNVASLEEFRLELAALLEQGGPVFSTFAERVLGMDSRQLLLTRDRVEQIPLWREALPRVLQAANSARVKDLVVAIERGELPQEQLEALEATRRYVLDFLQDGGARSFALSRRVEQASLLELALLDEVLAQAPPDATQALMVGLIDGSGFVPPGLLPIIAGGFDFDCDVSIPIPAAPDPTISLDFLCDPIEDVLNALDAAVTAVENTVLGLPDAILGALESFFVFLIDAALSPLGISSDGSFDLGVLQDALGLVGDFWENIPQLPQLPCPPAGICTGDAETFCSTKEECDEVGGSCAGGTDIPLFGPVGDEETASKYSRYLWVFEKILDMVPETEVSLVIKIPAELLFAGVQYLEVCLDSAAEMKSEQQTDRFREGTEARLEGLATQLANTGANLTAQLSEFRTQELKLRIEENLLLGGDLRISAFQLPEGFGGHLGFVREIVAGALVLTQASGGETDCAEEFLFEADDELADGNFKAAYDSYRKAYRETVKADNDDDECSDDEGDDS